MTAEPVKTLDDLPKIPKDRYSLIGVLGQGGMGIVVKARHAQLNKLVAIKVLNTVMMNDTSVKRFEIEAKAGSQLSHPNLIAVFDYGLTEDGKPYLVMEYVEGASLQDILISQGAPNKETFITIFEQIAKALQYIHKHNIVHRDIKSSNIMILKIEDDLYAKLLDFGIAKVLTDSALTQQHLTETGAVFGSPIYMSPEQCMGKQTDFRSDIYSLGCVMYECLSLRAPLFGENALQTIFMHINAEPPVLPQITDQDASMRNIARIIHKCLEKKPENRFQSTSELLKELASAKAAGDADQTNASRLAPHGESVINRWKKTAGDSSGVHPQPSAGLHSSFPPQSTPSAPASAPSAPPSFTQSVPPDPQAQAPRNTFEPGSLSHIGTAGLGHVGPSSDSESHRLIEGVHADSDAKKQTSSNLRKEMAREMADEPEEKPTSRKPLPLWSKVACVVIFLVLIGGGTPFAIDYCQTWTAAQTLSKAGESLKLQHWSDAEAHYADALRYAQSKNDNDTIGKINVGQGTVELHQNEISKARGHFTSALMLLDKVTKPSRDAYMNALIGLSETHRLSGNIKESEKQLNLAKEFAKMWGADSLIAGDIFLASTHSPALKSAGVDKLLNAYDSAIAKYDELKDPPAEKLARAWVESAELCMSNNLTKDAARRALRGLQISSQIRTEVIKEDLRRRAEPLSKVDVPTVGGAVQQAVPPVFRPTDVVIPSVPLPAMSEGLPPNMVNSADKRTSEELRAETANYKQKTQDLKDAEAAALEYKRLSDQRFKQNTELLRRLGEPSYPASE